MKQITLLILVFSALIIAGCGDKDSASNIKPISESDIVTALTNSSVNAVSTMPLTTEIPPELIEGTPQPIKVPNLELAPSSAPVLMVPEGTQLLSADKSVTSSDDFPIIGELSYITDGDKEAGEG